MKINKNCNQLERRTKYAAIHATNQAITSWSSSYHPVPEKSKG